MVFVIGLPTKLEIYCLQCLCIYLHNLWRQDIGFVGVVANLLNRPTDGTRSATKKVRPKNSYFSSACEYVKLPSSLTLPKNILFVPRASYASDIVASSYKNLVLLQFIDRPMKPCTSSQFSASFLDNIAYFNLT
jgi:hypothetical protein